MELGEKLATAGQNWKISLIPIIGMIFSGFIALVFFNSYIMITADLVKYNGSPIVFIILGVWMLLLAFICFLSFSKGRPRYTFVVYENGISVKGKEYTGDILYDDIDEFLHFYQTSGVLKGLMFKTEKSHWIIYTPHNGEEGLFAFKEAYYNHIYPQKREAFDNGEELTFHFIESSHYANQAWNEKDMFQIADKFWKSDNTIRLSKKAMNVNGKVTPMKEIISYSTGYGVQEISLAAQGEETPFTLQFGSVCKQDLFLRIIEEELENKHMPPIAQLEQIQANPEMDNL